MNYLQGSFEIECKNYDLKEAIFEMVILSYITIYV